MFLKEALITRDYLISLMNCRVDYKQQQVNLIKKLAEEVESSILKEAIVNKLLKVQIQYRIVRNDIELLTKKYVELKMQEETIQGLRKCLPTLIIPMDVTSTTETAASLVTSTGEAQGTNVVSHESEQQQQQQQQRVGSSSEGITNMKIFLLVQVKF